MTPKSLNYIGGLCYNLLDRAVLEKVLSVKDTREDEGQRLWPPGVCILLLVGRGHDPSQNK